MTMNITAHNDYLAQAQKLTQDNPDLHAEYRRRCEAGEYFKPGEPVTAYWKKLNSLNKKALKAVGC